MPSIPTPADLRNLFSVMSDEMVRAHFVAIEVELLSRGLDVPPTSLCAGMSAEAALAHITAAQQRIEDLGVQLTPDAKKYRDEIEECLIDHDGRTHNQLGLRRWERRFERELAQMAG